MQHKPRKPLKTTTTLKPKKRLQKIGKVARQTNAAVAKWKRTQKPNHEGYYECYICGAWITYLEAEHVKSKARNPKLRTDPTNLKPVCDPCNERKGSKDFELTNKE